jgi:lactoylglutathione lyase
MELVQIRLIVADFPACFRFYRDALGLRPQVDDDRGPYGKLTAEEGSCAVALHERANLQLALPGLRASEGPPGDRALVAFKVLDLDATLRELAARGVPLLQPPATQWGRLRAAYLRDPEGNLIELQEWLTAPAPAVPA